MKKSIEQIVALEDEQLIKLFNGKVINILYESDASCRGMVTGFINAAQAESSKRSIVAIILDGDNEIGISSQYIKSIERLS